MEVETERERIVPSDDELLFQPNISLNGAINEQTLSFFLGRLQEVRGSGGDVILEINTNGGDADVARRIALELKLFASRSGTAYVVGKTIVYSAGVTILAAVPRQHRYLTEDAVMLVHERRLEKNVPLNGPIQSCLQIVREQLALLETAQHLEKEGFRDLVEGSTLSLDELYELAIDNCYISAAKAKELGLIARVLS